MTDIVERRRRRERIETDPEARQQYDELIAAARELTGVDGDVRDIMLAAVDLVFDLNPSPPPRLRDSDPLVPGEDGRPGVMWATISFPVATEDMKLRREDLQFRYAMRETLAWLRGGITPAELSDMGLGTAWDVVSKWVDETRPGRLTPDEEAEILRDPGPHEPLAEVVSDPAIMSGDPTIRGTRVLAETILAYLRAGHTEADIHEDFPTLPPDGIGAVLRWDAQRRLTSSGHGDEQD